jgi:hypothetical protein
MPPRQQSKPLEVLIIQKFFNDFKNTWFSQVEVESKFIKAENVTSVPRNVIVCWIDPLDV